MSADGEITGVPLEETRRKGKPGFTEPLEFTVTATNNVAHASVKFRLEVVLRPSVLKYQRHELLCSIGEAIPDNDVVLCDGLPALPRRPAAPPRSHAWRGHVCARNDLALAPMER